MTDPTQAAQVAGPLPLRWRIRRAIRPALFRLRLLYGGTLYRPHMRLIHRFGWHLFTRLHPIGGEAQKWCQWCGERHIIYPAIKVDGPLKRSVEG